MSFLPAKDVSTQFQISVQTVYNYLWKFDARIRTKKQYGKVFIHLEDFTNVFKSSLKDVWFEASDHDFKRSIENLENWKGLYQKLEQEHKYTLSKTDQLQKHNETLQDQVSKYAIRFSDEKREKQELLEKYDGLQKDFHEKVESLYREKSGIEKKYSFSVGIAVFLLLLVVGISILFFFGKIAIG